MSTSTDNALKIYHSVTDYLDGKASNYLVVNKRDGKIKTATKLIVGTATYSVLTLGGAVETLFRHILLVGAKGIQFFIPKNYTSNFDKKILIPLYQQALLTTYFTAAVATKIVTNLFSTEERKEELLEAIFEGLKYVYLSSFMSKVVHFHIDGLK